MLSIPDSTLVTFKNEFTCNITIITADMAYIGMLPVFWMVTDCIRRSPAAAGAVVNGSSAVTAAAV